MGRAKELNNAIFNALKKNVDMIMNITLCLSQVMFKVRFLELCIILITVQNTFIPVWVTSTHFFFSHRSE